MLQNRARERCHQTGSRGPLVGDWFQEANKDSLVCALIECLIFLAVETCSYCLGFFFSRNLQNVQAPLVFREEAKSQLHAGAPLSPEPCSSPDSSVPPGSPILDRLPGMWPAPNFIFSSGLPGEKRVLPETRERGSSVHSHTSSLPPGLLPSSQALP